MSIPVFDAHCDTAFELWYRQETLERNTCHIDLEKAGDFSAYTQIFAFCSLAGEALCPGISGARDYLTKPLDYFRAELKKHPERIGAASSIQEAMRLNAEGKHAALFSLEGAEVIDCDPGKLEALFAQGFVMSTLTWNADNALAGWHGSDAGLTSAGRDFVAQAQRLGMAIDVSHLSEKAFWDLISVTKKPILASHSNCRALCDVSRNLTDDQLRAIRDTDGVVGLNLFVPFLGENADFFTVLRHLEHLLKLCGETNVVLGGDLDGCNELPRGFLNVGSYRELYRFLHERGFSERLLRRVFYDNLMEFLRKEVA